MTLTPETSSRPPSAAAPPRAPQPYPDRLYRVAAWVAIISGTLQTAATIVFSGCAIWCVVTGRTPPWSRADGRRQKRQGGK